jgi:hypothetical protein
MPLPLMSNTSLKGVRVGRIEEANRINEFWKLASSASVRRAH